MDGVLKFIPAKEAKAPIFPDIPGETEELTVKVTVVVYSFGLLKAKTTPIIAVIKQTNRIFFCLTKEHSKEQSSQFLFLDLYL